MFARTGHAQNIEKQVHVPMACGRGAKAAARNFHSKDFKPGGEVARLARYLGPLLNDMGTITDETTRRQLAACVGWLSMGSFWTSRAPISLKRVVFLSR
eukprot:8337149-Heterocapsa_arctica.AAC.1